MGPCEEDILCDERCSDLADGMRVASHEVVGERLAGHHMREGARAAFKTRKSAKTRGRIMEAASRLMVERHGMHFNMSEVSERCRMSKGSLYYYFQDKDDLVEAIFSREVEGFVNTLEMMVTRAASAHEAIRALCCEYERAITENGPLTLAMARELIHVRDGTIKEIEAHFTRVIALIAAQLERGKEEGIVRRDVDAQLAAMSLCGALSFAAMRSSLAGPVRGEVEGLGTRIFTQLAQGIGPSQGG